MYGDSDSEQDKEFPEDYNAMDSRTNGNEYMDSLYESNQNQFGEQNVHLISINRLINAINKNKWDRKSWIELRSELSNVELNEFSENIWKNALSLFPESKDWWLAYLKVKCAQPNRNINEIQRLFSDCSRKCYSPELWDAYIEFLKKIKLTGKSVYSDFNEYKNFTGYYDNALEYVGWFIDSNKIWKSYKLFLDELSKNVDHQEEVDNMKMNMLKNAYVSCNYDYEAFRIELSVDNGRLLRDAKNEINDLNKKKDNLKHLLNERTKIWNSINMSILSSPEFDTQTDSEQLQYWLDAIQLEEQNLLELPPNDYYQCVHNTIARALTYFKYTPEIWYEFALFENENYPEVQDRDDQTKKVFDSGLKTMKSSHYFYALICDFFEYQGKHELAKQYYEQGLKELKNGFLYAPYMKYMLRREGVTSMRQVFKRALTNNEISMQLFITAAHLEYFSNNAKDYAINIFRRGMYYYSNEPLYVLEFVRFLMNFGDYMNANTLVESYLPTFIQLKREKEKEKEKTKEKEKETEYKEFCSALSVFFEEYISILNKAMHKDTSIHDLYRIEQMYRETFPNKPELKGALFHFQTIDQIGYTKRTSEDEGFHKRKYPPEVVFVPTTTQEAISPVPEPIPVHVPQMTSVSIPRELQKFIDKLPQNARDKARSTHIAIIMNTFKNAKRPIKTREQYYALIAKKRA